MIVLFYSTESKVASEKDGKQKKAHISNAVTIDSKLRKKKRKKKLKNTDSKENSKGK